MTGERHRPPPAATELDMLVAWLDYHRATLALKCDGLPADRLRERSVPPSSLSLLGLVRHLADVERHWFRVALAGEDAVPLYYSDEDPDGDFDNVDGNVDEAFARWRAECDHSRAVLASFETLDELGRHHGRAEPVSVRWVLVHMIEEYARHNGHADLLRERIDGAVGE